MGHEIAYRSYPVSTPCAEITEKVNKVAEYNSENHTGLNSKIRWLDTEKPLDTLEEAIDFIKRQDNGWYDNIAVRYLAYEEQSGDKKRNELEQAVKKAYKAYIDKNNALYPKTLTSTFIGCKVCGSKLNREYVRTNYCPVCHKDLRTDTIHKSINSAKLKWDAASKKLADYEKTHRGKSTVMWLVKFEYHV